MISGREEVLHKHTGELLYCKGARALKQAAQEGCEVFSGDT